MPGLMIAAILGLLWIGSTLGGDGSRSSITNLNNPAALDALKQSNPTHYDKIQKILEAVFNQPDADTRWIQTNFDAQNVSYTPILLTSAPPQRRLSFAIDGTRYQAVVTITDGHGKIIPVN